jgi:hypothetical protein
MTAQNSDVKRMDLQSQDRRRQSERMDVGVFVMMKRELEHEVVDQLMIKGFQSVGNSSPLRIQTK